jgi:hypothetical protein
MCAPMQRFESAITHATLSPSSLASRDNVDELLSQQHSWQPPQRWDTWLAQWGGGFIETKAHIGSGTAACSS